jgi:hypothetical protein
MNMKKLILALAFFASTAAASDNQFAGIYRTIPYMGYVYVKENDGQLVAVINKEVGQDTAWEAYQGPIDYAAGKAVVTSIIGNGTAVFELEVLPGDNLGMTQISCVPDPGKFCYFQDGAYIIAYKVW